MISIGTHILYYVLLFFRYEIIKCIIFDEVCLFLCVWCEKRILSMILVLLLILDKEKTKGFIYTLSVDMLEVVCSRVVYPKILK